MLDEAEVRREVQSMEAKHGIRILWLSHNGSRAWGLEHAGSDYDLRGVFRYASLSSYVTLHPGHFQSTITEFTTATSDGNPIDWHLWDISRVLKSLAARALGNVEWLFSPRVYDLHPAWTRSWQSLLSSTLGVDELVFRLASLARSLSKCIASSDTPTKMCMIAIRPMLLALWVRSRDLTATESLYNPGMMQHLTCDLVQLASYVVPGTHVLEIVRQCALQLKTHPGEHAVGRTVSQEVRCWIESTYASTASTSPMFTPDSLAAWDAMLFAWISV